MGMKNKFDLLQIKSISLKRRRKGAIKDKRSTSIFSIKTLCLLTAQKNIKENGKAINS
jgi:hypothetical protein